MLINEIRSAFPEEKRAAAGMKFLALILMGYPR